MEKMRKILRSKKAAILAFSSLLLVETSCGGGSERKAEDTYSPINEQRSICVVDSAVVQEEWIKDGDVGVKEFVLKEGDCEEDVCLISTQGDALTFKINGEEVRMTKGDIHVVENDEYYLAVEVLAPGTSNATSVLEFDGRSVSVEANQDIDGIRVGDILYNMASDVGYVEVCLGDECEVLKEGEALREADFETGRVREVRHTKTIKNCD